MLGYDLRQRSLIITVLKIVMGYRISYHFDDDSLKSLYVFRFKLTAEAMEAIGGGELA